MWLHLASFIQPVRGILQSLERAQKRYEVEISMWPPSHIPTGFRKMLLLSCLAARA